MVDNRPAACFWSSGKDSCLSLFIALRQGYRVTHLLNFISGEYKRVSFHGARAELVGVQADCLGVQLLQRETTEKNYEEIFKKTLEECKAMGIDQVVRGDIHLQDLKDWVQERCTGQGMTVISPLWHRDTLEILNDFVSSGFKAVITSAQADKLDASWVGRQIDKTFIEDIRLLKGVDPCGENGEYHSFVYDGPLFQKRIEVTKTEKVKRGNFWFLDIQDYMLSKKEEV